MKSKTRIHDGIVGAIILLSVVMSIYVDARWLVLAGVIGALMVLSSLTGFCLIYRVLGKFIPCNDSKDKCCS